MSGYGRGFEQIADERIAAYGLIAPNTYTVGASGCHFTSVQDAVTAASAVATVNSPWFVTYDPGTELTFTPAENVYVVPARTMMDYAESVNGDNDLADAPWQPWQVPYDMPLVAVVCDDGVAIDATDGSNGGWFAVPQGAVLGAGVTPFQYCMRLGIPVSQAIFPNVITTPARVSGNYTYMTPAQLRWCQLYNGAEILSHSYIHQTEPTTQSELLKEVLGSKSALMHLQATDYTAPTGETLVRSDATDTVSDDLGAAVRGFVWPGSWTETFGKISAMRGPVHRFIRTNYQYSTSAGASITSQHIQGELSSRHALWRGRLSSVTANAANINTLGTRSILYFHAYGPSQNWASWKTAIDILAAARDAGTIALVTPSTVCNAISVPQNAGHRSLWGGVPNGDFADGNVMWTKSTSASIADGVATLGIGDAIYMQLPLKGGHSYTMRFNAKVTGSGSTVLKLYHNYRWIALTDGTPHYLSCAHLRTLTNLADPGATPYDTAYPQYHTFYVPTWCQQVELMIRCDSGTAGDTMIIDNVELALA